MRAITEREKEAHQKQDKIRVVKDTVRDADVSEFERRIFESICKDDEGDVKVGLQKSK